MTAKQLAERATESASPTPRRRPLATLADVRREMAAIYWECRRGKRPTADGSRLLFMLDRIAGLITTSELEPRIAELEARFATQASE